MRVVVLGAGFGGLELTTRLSEEFGDDVDVVLIDQSDGFVFGFSKLDVMFGRIAPRAGASPLPRPRQARVQFVQSTIRAIDPDTKRVETDAGTFDADILVVALGADLHPEATPGLVEGGHEFYTVAGAFALRDVLADFAGGRVIVGVTSTPFKCPPAPSETALLMHDFLTDRGLAGPIAHLARHAAARLRSRRHPTRRRRCWPRSPSGASTGTRRRSYVELDPERRVALLGDGTEMPYDLFLGVPAHRAPAVVAESGMTVDGWIPVDPHTLETRFPGVYAVGDVTSVGTPKAGVFAEGQAAVVADGISAVIRGAGESVALRRPRHLLPRVRPRPGRQGRRHVHERSGAPRLARRPVARDRGRQGRVRHQSHPALVRAHVAVSAASIRPSRTR